MKIEKAKFQVAGCSHNCSEKIESAHDGSGNEWSVIVRAKTLKMHRHCNARVQRKDLRKRSRSMYKWGMEGIATTLGVFEVSIFAAAKGGKLHPVPKLVHWDGRSFNQKGHHHLRFHKLITIEVRKRERKLSCGSKYWYHVPSEPRHSFISPKS